MAIFPSKPGLAGFVRARDNGSGGDIMRLSWKYLVLVSVLKAVVLVLVWDGTALVRSLRNSASHTLNHWFQDCPATANQQHQLTRHYTFYSSICRKVGLQHAKCDFSSA